MKKLICALVGVLFIFGLSCTAVAADRVLRDDFHKIPGNNKGYLTYEDIKAKYPNYNEELHEHNDVNKDGKISPHEWYRALIWPDALEEIEIKREAARKRTEETAGFLKDAAKEE